MGSVHVWVGRAGPERFDLGMKGINKDEGWAVSTSKKLLALPVV